MEHGSSGMIEALDTSALSYLAAAEVLWKKSVDENTDMLIAPCTQSLGQGVELFLKARLAERGWTEKQLKGLGHNICKMWFLDEAGFGEFRVNAQKIAEACKYKKSSPFPDPEINTMNQTIRELSRLYSSESNYALRYPSNKHQVPYPQPLLWVMYEVATHSEKLFPR